MSFVRSEILMIAYDWVNIAVACTALSRKQSIANQDLCHLGVSPGRVIHLKLTAIF
jgi:hypothetical protein